jgi:hypothetical protein
MNEWIGGYLWQSKAMQRNALEVKVVCMIEITSGVEDRSIKQRSFLYVI